MKKRNKKSSYTIFPIIQYACFIGYGEDRGISG
jgi:hypothetical protein